MTALNEGASQKNPQQQKKPQSQKSKLRLRAWLVMLRATRFMENTVRLKFRDQDSTLSRFDVMSVLDRYPDGLKMSEVSGKLKVSNGNVTGIIDRLVQDGLVIRQNDQNDKRVMFVKLTPQGQTRFKLAAEKHEVWIADLLADFTQDELTTLTKLLSRIGKV